MPIWRNLKALPARVEELERRLAALEEGAKAPRKSPGQPCPACGEPAYLLTNSERSKGPFGALGAMDRTYICGECGFSETKLEDK